MGVLIPLSASNAATRRALPAGETAAILFFTGVRYYRMPDAVEPETAKPRRRRAPKVAKLPTSARLDCHA